MIALNLQNPPSFRQRLTAGEIARELGMDRATVMKRIRELRIVSVVPGVLEYTPDDVERIAAHGAGSESGCKPNEQTKG